MSWTVGDRCIIANLNSNTELNDKPAAVVSFDTKRERWNVLVDGHPVPKCIKPDNLFVDEASTEAEGAPPEIVAVGARQRIAVVTARRGDSLILVEFLNGDSVPQWSMLLDDESDARVGPSHARRLADADESEIPTELLAGARVLARDTHKCGGPPAFADATVGETRQDQSGRLHVFVEWDGDASRGQWLSADDVRGCEALDDDDDDFEEPPAGKQKGRRAAPAKAPAKAPARAPAKVKGKAADAVEVPACGGKRKASAASDGDPPPAGGKTAGGKTAGKTAGKRPTKAASGSAKKRKAAADDDGDAGWHEEDDEEEGLFESAPPAAKARRGKRASAGESSSGGGGSEAGPSRAEREAAKATGMANVGGSSATGGESLRSTQWSKKNRRAADEWEASLEAMEMKRVTEADGEDGGAGGDEAIAPAPAPAAAPAKDPRMQGFRIGGQAETEEERGEGWCGPWSTATRLIERREAEKLEREQAIAEGAEVAPLETWTPRRDPLTAPPRSRRPVAGGGPVPALQQLCVNFLVANIDAVASFGVLSGGVHHAIANGLRTVRKLDDAALELLTQADASVTELIIPDCSHVSEDGLVAALTRLTTPPADFGAMAPAMPQGLLDLNPEDDDDDAGCGGGGGGGHFAFGGLPRLTLLELDFGGHPFTNAASALLHAHTSLESLRLKACYKLSNAALTGLMAHVGGGLHELVLSFNSQLNAEGVTAIAKHCPRLTTLRLEDCQNLPPDALTPLRALTRLETLSLGGLFLLNDETIVALTGACSDTLTTLSLRACQLISPDAIVTIARTCTNLRDLDLEGVELITDAAAAELADGLPALERLVLKSCVQLSDAAIERLAAGCPGLARVSLNKIPALSDRALAALRKHCAETLTALDISWLRGVSDHGVGALVDACERLDELRLWGCTQLTRTFFDGHSRDELTVIGRPVG